MTTTKNEIRRAVILGLILLASVTAAAADGELRFVQKGDMVDLAELRDGERRSFGEGDHRVIATRTGDTVHLGREPGADGREIDITCDVTRDTCQIMTAPDDEHVVIKIEKRRDCVGDECDEMDIEVMAFAGGEGMAPGPHAAHVRTMVIERGDCDDGEDCNVWVTDNVAGVDAQVVIERIECTDDGEGDGEACETFTWHGDQAGSMPFGVHGLPGKSMVFIDDGGQATVLGGSSVMLACPEGDAQLRVDEDEADSTFLCPKHSVPMERIKAAFAPHGAHGGTKRIKIERR